MSNTTAHPSARSYIPGRRHRPSESTLATANGMSSQVAAAYVYIWYSSWLGDLIGPTPPPTPASVSSARFSVNRPWLAVCTMAKSTPTPRANVPPNRATSRQRRARANHDRIARAAHTPVVLLANASAASAPAATSERRVPDLAIISAQIGRAHV